jgi:Gluconate 2-dehydrogenase subunit 3
MNRRSVLRNVGLGVMGLSGYPAWATNWNIEKLSGFTFTQSVFFAKIVGAIIPETTSPGAKTIGAHLFVERMLKDCFPEKMQESISKTIANLESEANAKYKKSFAEISNIEVLELLKNNTEDKSNILMLKNLTVRAYTNSEYFLTTHDNYQMAPGYFHGCVNA